MTPPTDAPDPADPPRPEVGRPPFQDLVKPGGDPPAVPHFGPLDPPDEEGDRRPTLADRWRALPPRRQKQLLGAGVVVIAAGVFLWPTHTEALPPRPEPRAEVAPPVVQQVPGLVTPVEIRLIRFRMAAAAIPVNTHITAENLKTLFTDHEAKFGPDGAVTTADRVVGKYVVAELNPGQIATRAAFADQPLPPAVAVAPPPREVGPADRRVVRVLTRSGTRVTHYELWPETGWRVGREEFLPATADAAKTGGLP